MQGDVRSESAHVRQRHTTPHLAGELFKFMAGVDTVDVDLIIGRPPESDAKFLNVCGIDDLNLLPHFRGIVGSTIQSRLIAIL